MPLPPIAFIDEPNCIGCALCLKVCPTDAIVGSAKHLHAVIAADCTGCDKCLPVCPTDCISMRPRVDEAATPRQLAGRWRARVARRRARIERQRAEDRATRARLRPSPARPRPA